MAMFGSSPKARDHGVAFVLDLEDMGFYGVNVRDNAIWIAKNWDCFGFWRIKAPRRG